MTATTAWTPPEQEPVTIRRVWPAEVATPNGVIRPALVIVTRSHVYVFTGKGEPPVLAVTYDPVDSTLTAEHRIRTEPLILATADGQVTVNRTRASGCGPCHPLNSWVPWTPDRRSPQ